METAVGECMLPTIQDGDLLFVDTSEPKFSGFGIYVLEIAGERLVKRVQPKLDGSLTLISDNSAYETEHVPAAKAERHPYPGSRAVGLRPGAGIKDSLALDSCTGAWPHQFSRRPCDARLIVTIVGHNGDLADATGRRLSDRRR